MGPVWKGGFNNEKTLLESCYRTSLELAVANKCDSVAFPLISSGVYGYPKDQALKVAIDVISDFLFSHDLTVYIVVFDKKAYTISEKLFSEIAEYIDDNYADEHSDYSRRIYSNRLEDCRAKEVCCDEEMLMPMEIGGNLNDILKQLDESFSEMLLRKIDESGMTDSECYKKANIDRKLFSKIRSDKEYRPSKPTVLAFAIALNLSLDETQDMLMKAGFALSHSNKFDVIIEYFIVNENYNIHEINEALFAFDQSLLGA